MLLRSERVRRFQPAAVRTAGQRGFTLLEIVVVLALIGILLTLGAVNVRGAIQREETDSWVRAIVYDIAAGQQAAMTLRTNVTTTVSGSGKIYTIAASSGGTLRQDTVPGHITLTIAPIYGFSFDRRGVPSDAAAIGLRSSSGRNYEIRVAEGTGRVSYVEE